MVDKMDERNNKMNNGRLIFKVGCILRCTLDHGRNGDWHNV